MSNLNFTLRFSAGAAALLACCNTPVCAQSPIPLPGIVVQGATLEKAPVARRAPKPADVEEDDAPQPKKAAKIEPDDEPAAQAKVVKAAPAVKASTPKASKPQVAAASAPIAQVVEPAPQFVAPIDGASDRLAAGIPASEIGTALTVVTAKDIQQQQARTSADVLRALPGVTVTGSGSVGGVTQVRLRGADGRHTRVLIDGVEVNTTKDAEYDFSNLSPEDIERIEVIRGPMSALYGSGAIGGVVNIETKGARGPLGLSVRAEGGSFGTRDLAGRLAGGNESGFISLTGQVRDVRGFAVAPGGVVNNGTQLQTYGMHAGITVAPTAKLDMTLRYTDKKAGFDDFGVDYLTPFAQKPYQTADDAHNTLIERSMLAGLRFSWDSLGGALTQEIKGNYTSDVSANRFQSIPLTPFDTSIINHTRDESSRSTVGYSATYRLPTSADFGRHSVTGLIEKQTETFRPFSDYSTTYGDYNGDGLTRTRSRLSYAGEWRGTFAERLSLSAGGRFDDNDAFKDFATWRTSASYDFKEIGLRPHASLGTGVKLPGLYDQYGANSKQYQSNPNLRPETSTGYDVGVEQKLLGGRILADVTYFHSDLKDKIFLNCCDPTTYRFFTDNALGTTIRQGVEVSARYRVSSALELGAAYTYTDATQPNGQPEYRRVPHGGRLDARYSFDEGRGTVSIAAIGNSRTPDVAFLNDGTYKSTAVDLGGYWLVQLAASYKIQPNVEVYGRIENALNKQYQEIYGYSTAGIGAYAGVKIKFDDLLGTGKK